ncbi:quinon protein alcohol dehydrogenase-like superfamily [Xylariaceae sp. FL0016]|nr:quinon protein alcohol dehydrogenase-like superfamily [Xylariaceae sp. FL0016]
MADIHRCRFVEFPPSGINALAFNYSTSGSGRSRPVRLAIGRANGQLEIWHPLNGLWHQEVIIHGGKDRSIDGLVWVNEPDQFLPDGTKFHGRSRLFSIGYTSTVTEWDLEKGRPKREASGMHGDIWCLGAQPSVVPSKDGDKAKAKALEGKLVAGTIDGSLVLYSVADDELQFDRILVRSSSKKTKMVSIAFQSRHIAVVGCSDSSIRVYDLRNGALLRRLTLGSDLAGGAKEIIVWSIKCLDGGDIISGDSTGHVCVWDGKTYTQAQRLQSHKQDVLSLAVSPNGSTIMSGGMDRKTVLYKKTARSGRWAKVWARRYHSHDVKTMASFEGNGMSVVVSGGPDANPIIMPLQKAGVENHRVLSNLPQRPPLQSARKGRLVVSWWDREIHIWRLKKSLDELVRPMEGETGVDKNRKLLANLHIKGEANITSATISEDGSLLAVSTPSDIKAFHLQSRDIADHDERPLKISKVEIPAKIAVHGATQLAISPDGRWLCVIQNGSSICLLSILEEPASSKPSIHPKAIRLQRIKRDIPKYMAFSGLGLYDRVITHVTFSPDSKVLACADLSGYIDSWILSLPREKVANGTDETDNSSDESASDSEDESGTREGLKWTTNPNGSLIPKLHSAPTVLSFSNYIPSSADSNDDEDDYNLLAITAKPQILLIHPLRGCLSPWSRRNPISRFPTEFRNIRDLVKGVLWSGARIWLYGSTYLFMFDLSQDIALPDTAETMADGTVVQRSKKRKRGLDSGAGNKMERGAIGPHKVLRHIQGKKTKEISTDGPLPDPMDQGGSSPESEDSESEDSEAEAEGELALMRGEQAKASAGSGTGQSTTFWHTYKYRPILGMVPLCSETEEETASNGDSTAVTVNGTRPKMIEMALVERPLYEMELADRYFGDGEYDR